MAWKSGARHPAALHARTLSSVDAMPGHSQAPSCRSTRHVPPSSRHSTRSVPMWEAARSVPSAISTYLPVTGLSVDGSKASAVHVIATDAPLSTTATTPIDERPGAGSAAPAAASAASAGCSPKGRITSVPGGGSSASSSISNIAPPVGGVAADSTEPFAAAARRCCRRRAPRAIRPFPVAGTAPSSASAPMGAAGKVSAGLR